MSNTDNLGATLDLDILTQFAHSQAGFWMECCERTPNDQKGGHLALRRSDKRLVIRESAMCPPNDQPQFEDIAKHKYFNTNNLWIRLDKLKEIINKLDKLPLIVNHKTVNPKDDQSNRVIQLETAMGSAVEFFDDAAAIVVPRTRFVPVKKCQDLLLLQSDVYGLDNDNNISHDQSILKKMTSSKIPTVDLSQEYKTYQGFQEATIAGIPSLKHCTSLSVQGPVQWTNATTFLGEVSIFNNSTTPKLIPGGNVSGTLDLTHCKLMSNIF